MHHPQHNCPDCGGRMEPQTIAHEYKQKDVMVLVENVPAFVCVQCGCVYLDADVIASLEHIVTHNQPVKTIATSVYEFETQP